MKLTFSDFNNINSYDNIYDIELYLNEVKDKMKREEILNKHPYKIWQTNQGKWKTRVPDSAFKDGKKIITNKTRDGLLEAIVEHYKSIEEEEQIPTYKDLFEESNKDQSDVTYRKYSSVFKRFYSDLSNTKITDVSEHDWEIFIIDKFNEGLTSKSYADLKTITKSMLKLARYKVYTDINPTTFFDNIYIQKHQFKKSNTKKNKYYTNEEYHKIKNYILDNLNSKNIALLVQMQTGCRIGEIVGLKFSDVDYKNNRIHIHHTEQMCMDKNTKKSYRTIADQSKTEKGDRYVYVSEDTIKLFKLVNSDTEYIFPYSTKQLSYNLKKICNQLNIEFKGTHAIRATHASKLRKVGASNEFIISQLGHTDINTTNKYYIHDLTNQEEAKLIVNSF